MSPSPFCVHRRLRRSVSAAGFLLTGLSTAALAQGIGIASLGATGGLHIPSAYVLEPGDMAASFGNYRPPRLGNFTERENYSLGFGLLPHVELFGRVTDYTRTNPRTGLPLGARDLSANAKLQLPIDVRGVPKVALGVTDVGGAANYFKSKYIVASDELGALRWTLGYARGTARDNTKVLDGLFGGAEIKLGTTRATMLVETDGTQRHAGLRYYSPMLPWLGSGQLIGSVHRSFGAVDPAGRSADSTRFNVSYVMPLGTDDATRRARADGAAQPLLPLNATMVASDMPDTAIDKLEKLSGELRGLGLERVRAGLLGADVVIEYENHRYLHNEVDALGIVLGLASELAPAGTRRVHALTLKAGQTVFETSVEVAAFRELLRGGEPARARATMGFSRLSTYDAEAVRWTSMRYSTPAGAGALEGRFPVRFELKPLLNYALASEFGVLDYSLAANLRGTVGLWKGAEAYADIVQRVAASDDVAPRQAFADLAQRNGLRTLALQQSFWLGDRWFNSVGAGLYQHDLYGGEGESTYFVPYNDDTVHVKGVYMRRERGQGRDVEALSGTYRWKITPSTWLEGGYNAYTDRTTGPSLMFTRWMGDVAVQLFTRKGGGNTFAGIEVSFPLTPRQGYQVAGVNLNGTARYEQPFRTRVSGAERANLILPNATRPVNLNYESETEMLNSGRVTQGYISGQLERMRESFFLYGRGVLP